MTNPWRPTKAQLHDAYGAKVPDLVADNLDVLFCGINPSLYSGAVGHHFARPGNRFWPALYQSGFTDKLLSPFDERDLLAFGLGITNFVNRATATADELSVDELRNGALRLRRKVARFKPRFVAPLGVTAYRAAFDRRHATVGLQQEMVGGAAIWVLPNPSGLNAHYQLPDLVREFESFRRAVQGSVQG